MPRGGVNRKPLTLLKAEGTYRTDRHGKSRLKPPPTRPVMPKGLSLEAQREWRRVVAELDKLGLLSRLDRAILATYAQSWSRWLELQARLEREGEAADFHVRVAARHEANAVRLLANELGLSPAARARLPVPEPSQDGPIPGGVR